MKLQVNKKLLPMKGHFFLFMGGIAPIQPFMPVIAKDLNFSSTAVGIINGVLPVCGMFSKPIFGAIADRFRLHKFVFIAFQILTIIGFFNIQFLSKIETDTGSQVKLVCGAETNIDICFKEPSKRTECLINDVLEESKTEKVVKCSLRCDLSEDLRTELCGPWKANPKICSGTAGLRSNLAQYTHIAEGSSIRGHVNYTTDESLDDVKLEFIATIPMKHTLKVAQCLYFRVADAQLNDETHHVPYCEHEADTQCKIHCDDSKLSELLKTQENTSPENNFVNFYQFWVYFFLAILSWVGMAVVGSVADAVCFELLGEDGHLYGYQRMWGSVGWGILAIVTGLVVDSLSVNGHANYTPAFYMMAVFLLCDVFNSYYLKYEQAKLCSNIFGNVGKLLKDIYVVIFLLWCIVIGMCIGIQWTFLFWHLEDLRGCDQRASQKTLLGLVSGVQCFLGELPSFFLFGWVVKKIGHVHTMSLIPFVIGIRFILYSVLTNPWWTLPIELLQFSVGLTFATMASYASIVAPPGTEATVQGLVGAIFEGIGVSLGSYLGGIIWNQYKGSGLFQIFAIIAFSLCLTHGVVHYVLGRTSQMQTRGKDFNGIAKYVSPNEAVSMLEDT